MKSISTYMNGYNEFQKSLTGSWQNVGYAICTITMNMFENEWCFKFFIKCKKVVGFLGKTQ
ncbi:hypothetical protein PUN4_100139 [Paraburkholderia unamae]|nr:hypothetical protein PUN4_100139 [Paraburkholderia unamae]